MSVHYVFSQNDKTSSALCLPPAPLFVWPTTSSSSLKSPKPTFFFTPPPLLCTNQSICTRRNMMNGNHAVAFRQNMDEDDHLMAELDDLDLEFNEKTEEDEEELDEYDMLTKVTDTSASLARKGKDIQGIPWDRLNITRDEYRSTRLEHYKNYENFPSAGEVIKEQCKSVSKDGHYFNFFYNSRMVKPTILHFQLRNLIWATSKHDVYLMSNYSLMHWSSISARLTEILNFSGNVAPNEKHVGNIPEGFTRTQISTLAVKDKIMVLGGFQGELICKRLNKQGVSFCSRTSYEDNAISNAIEIYDTFSNGLRFMASSNDGGIREYDIERFQMLNHFRFPWAVNHTSVSPDSKHSIVVGDDLDGLLIDTRNGKTISPVSGHVDYSFASAWHPNGLNFATGNQDKTTRVWDIRNLSSSVATLKGNIGAVRSLRFSTDGQFMVAAEAADFVHIYNTKTNYEEEQEIDFFGEISGVSLSPDDESIYIGIWDRTYASMLQCSRRRPYQYLDYYN